jgi:hypothetical protein
MNLEQTYQHILELNHDLIHLAEQQHWQAFADEKKVRDALITQWFLNIQKSPGEQSLEKIEQLKKSEKRLIDLCEKQQQEISNEIKRLQKQKDLAAKFSF